jgi:preprotein translocase subunit SecD
MLGGTMRIRSVGFNLYLTVVLATGVLLTWPSQGKDKEDKKALSTLRLHIETTKAEAHANSGANPKADPFAGTETADVYRAHKIPFLVIKEPFLSEAMVKEAKVIEVTGGFALQIQFDEKGTWLLEEYTGAYRSRHIVIASQFFNPGETKINLGRWLAAPQIHTKISDGLLVFTPDASREEADQIALGLNHVAKILATGRNLKF